MSRTIKFRAWIQETGRHSSWMNYGEIGDMVDYMGNPGNPVMQFTGLTDKNGRDIYEGDIVKEPCSNPQVNWTYEVYYDEGDAKFWVRNRDGVLGQYNAPDDPAYPSWSNYEVIGNIYEDSHLLDQAKEEAGV